MANTTSLETKTVLYWVIGLALGIAALSWFFQMTDRRLLFFIALAGGLLWLRIVNGTQEIHSVAVLEQPVAQPTPVKSEDHIRVPKDQGSLLSPQEARLFLDTFLQDQQKKS